MLGKKSGVVVRLRKIYLLEVHNYCLGHTAFLPCKAICNHIDYMCTFQTHTFKILNLIKLSPAHEHALEEYKKTAPCDKLNEDLSKVRKVLSWKPTCFTQNFNSLDSIKKNYLYLHATFENMLSLSATSDSIMRGRLFSACKNLELFNYLFILLLSQDFLQVVGSLNATFQDQKKSLSYLIDQASRTMSVLIQS